MGNVFQTRLQVDVRYDLKGSLWGRQTIDPAKGYNVDRTVELKDQDFLNQKQKFKVGPIYHKKLVEIIKKDAQFFGQNNIIDYSLLVGIHNRSEHPSDVSSSFQSPQPMMEFDQMSGSETDTRNFDWNEGGATTAT